MLYGLLTVVYFLMSLVFTIVLFLLWAKIFLSYFRVSSLHPASQMVDQLTQPVIQPMQNLLYPKKKTPLQYHWIAFVVIIGVEVAKVLCLSFIVYGKMLPLTYFLLMVIADLLIQPLNLLFYALLVRIIMSWLNPQWQRHPINEVITRVTDPLIAVGHKLIPNISGFDFAPFIMLIILKVITLFIGASLPLPLL